MSQDESASTTLGQIEAHTDAARSIASDALWTTASALPWVGPNFIAVRELALSADDLVDRAAKPALGVVKTLDWNSFTPTNGKIDVTPLARSSSSIVSAASTLELTYTRLSRIDPETLVPQVSGPLVKTTQLLDEFRHAARTAADASKILPSMLGEREARNYLILVQNNAEVRATGGLPGSLVVLHVENGTISLTAQSTGAAMGPFRPPLPADPVQTQIYTSRLGTFIGDVNLTPDFPTTGKLAKAMWEARFKTTIDGVIAIDPIVLAHILDASGPIPSPAVSVTSVPGDLPRFLTGANVVKTLLSDVYEKIDDNDMQDAYFTAVSEKIFSHISSGAVSGDKLVSALTKSAEERRLNVWSNHLDEQKILENSTLSSATSGPGVGGASFGAYFNDGTGAKMDFHVKRTVQLIQECPVDGYNRATVRITISNEAPLDAATALPKLVTGGGIYGVPPGSVQTNVVVYGPTQSHIETVHQDKAKTPFGSQVDGERPVGIFATRLKPGQHTSLDFTFRKIVQHDEPVLLVTPTVQPVEEVIKPPVLPVCPSL